MLYLYHCVYMQNISSSTKNKCTRPFRVITRIVRKIAAYTRCILIAGNVYNTTPFLCTRSVIKIKVRYLTKVSTYYTWEVLIKTYYPRGVCGATRIQQRTLRITYHMKHNRNPRTLHTAGVSFRFCYCRLCMSYRNLGKDISRVCFTHVPCVC